MLISDEKAKDREWRIFMLEIAASALASYSRTGEQRFLDFAKFFGEESRKTQHRIDTKDYSKVIHRGGIVT
jgi:hypothetical protein